MIKLIENPREITTINKSDPYILRIKTLYRTYGMCNYTSFWVQNNNTYISRCYDSFIVSSGKDADIEELDEFLRMCSAKTVFTDNNTDILKSHKLQVGITMKYDSSKSKINNTQKQNKELSFLFDAPLDKVYEILQSVKSDAFPVPDYKIFTEEASLRIKHGCGKALIMLYKNTPVATVYSGDIFNNTAVITAVAVKKEFSGMRFGSTITKFFIEKLGANKDIFVHRHIKENKSFYENLGFCEYGKWKEIQLLADRG